MRRFPSRSVVLPAAFALAAVLGACAGDGAATDEGSIIGGAPSRGARLDAVGSLARPVSPAPSDGGAADADADAGGDAGASPAPFKPFCTATLVAPTLVLTAKHCVDSDRGGVLTDHETITFNVGPDGARPKRAVEVARTWLAPANEGGFVKLGVDVALLELREPIDDVVPLPMLEGHVGEEAVGARFSAVGFGYRDRARSIGERRAGTLTLHATSGQFMAKVFGSADEVVAHAKAESPEAFDRSDASRLVDLYAKTLLPDAEVFLGLGDGDSQPCSGDSGGPLLARSGDRLVVVAVVSGSHKLSGRSANPCSVLGEVYATFGPVVQTMLTEVEAATGAVVERTPLGAVHAGSSATLPPAPPRPDAASLDGSAGPPDDGWEDGDEPVDGGAASGALDPAEAEARCRGLRAEGVCEDGAVLRCIPQAEGPPRATRVDCTLLLSACVRGTDGIAECAD